MSPTISLAERGINVVYYHPLKCTLFCMPDNLGAMYYSDGKWGWWSVESMVRPSGAGGSRPEVGVSQNILNPWMVANNSDLFVIGSPNENQQGEMLTNSISGRSGLNTGDNTRSRSFYILKYGRGGAVDRSVEAGEDRRHVVGRWTSFDEQSTSISPANSDHYLYLDKPVPIPPGFILGTGATASSAADAVEGAVWVPIQYVRGALCSTSPAGRVFHEVRDMDIRFSYDETKWQPILQGGSTTSIQYFLPPSRMASDSSWSAFKSDDAGLSDASGGYVQISMAAPSTSFRLWNKNDLMWIPFRPVDQSQAVGMGVDFTPTGVGVGGIARALGFDDAAAAVFADIRTYVWEETRLGDSQHQDNNVAQAVDWAYKSGPVGAPGGVQVKGRGLSVVAVSHGAAYANNRVQPDWPFGLLNIIGGADFKEWSSQVVDILPAGSSLGVPAVVLDANNNTLRTRYKDNATAALVTTTFNQTDGPKYGASGDLAESYRYLVGDDEVGQLSISDNVRGERVSYMLWGHIQNKAERVFIQSAKVLLRVIGGKRRTGR